MEVSWTAQRAANRLARILDVYAQAHGAMRFPVDVESLALDAASLFGWSDPISQVQSASIPGFEGALLPGDAKREWLLLYNDRLRTPGRIRFTQAHELGHYILHRLKKESFYCSDEDMLDWSKDEEDFESQADLFASYLLMPLDDFRKQITGTSTDLEMLSHCAERYGVSLTAAILKWLQYTDERAVLVLSNDGFMNWACSSEPAFKAGAYYATRSNVIPIPAQSQAANSNVKRDLKGLEMPASVWFPHAAPHLTLREMKVQSEHYDSIITLLRLPRGAQVWPARDTSIPP